jgi:hypothetical protein
MPFMKLRWLDLGVAPMLAIPPDTVRCEESGGVSIPPRTGDCERLSDSAKLLRLSCTLFRLAASSDAKSSRSRCDSVLRSRLWWLLIAFSHDGVSDDAGEAARGVECDGVAAGLDAVAGSKDDMLG